MINCLALLSTNAFIRETGSGTVLDISLELLNLETGSGTVLDISLEFLNLGFDPVAD